MTDPLTQARREIDGLRRRLAEAHEIIRAIQSGEVDAVVVDAGPPQVFVLDPADKPYRLMVEQLQQSAAMLTVDGTVMTCNEQFAHWLRCEREALRGRPLLEWVEAPDRPLVAALLREALATSVEREVVLCRGDGERLPAVLGVRALHEGPVGTCLLVVDVTEQKRRERLIADGAMARAILEQVADAVVVCDNGGTVLRASRALHDLCGTNPLYQPFHQICALTRLGERVDLAAVWRGEAVRGLEVVFERPGGGRAELLLNASPLVAAGGERLGVVITLTDITALRGVQDELRRHTTELQENDRRKDEFLAMLAHELRNPLSPIQSSLEIMHLKALDDPLARRCREVIGRQVVQLTRLVDDLLEVSRINTGKIELRMDRVDLTAAVQQGIETSRPVVDAKGHRLTLTVKDEALWVRADLTRVSQVVGNLINNAAKYTEAGGSIAVQIERDGDQAVIRVRDSGIGIPREMLTAVFDLFTQVNRSLDRSQGGLGIGLALVKRLIAMHGGKVEAYSEGPGKGSEFVVRLPLWQGERNQAAVDEGRTAGDRQRLRVLVVDDNTDAADLLSELLGILGHEVSTAADGPSAIVTAREVVPHVVLCDIGLPLLDGYGVVAQLRAQPELAATRFIALSGYGRAEDRERSQASGFHDHLIKPVDVIQLETLLASLP